MQFCNMDTKISLKKSFLVMAFNLPKLIKMPVLKKCLWHRRNYKKWPMQISSKFGKIESRKSKQKSNIKALLKYVPNLYFFPSDLYSCYFCSIQIFYEKTPELTCYDCKKKMKQRTKEKRCWCWQQLISYLTCLFVEFYLKDLLSK